MNFTKELGKVVVWIGNEAEHWTLEQHWSAAKILRALGIDTACVKMADGGNRWYIGLSGLHAIRNTYLANGVGCCFFQYVYGPAVSSTQYLAEAAITHELHSVEAAVMIDAEAEYDDEAAYWQLYCEAIKDVIGDCLVTTWANIADHRWEENVAIADQLGVGGWVPQIYNQWLAVHGMEQWPYTGHAVFHGLDVTGEFGEYDQAAYATTNPIFLWEYVPATTSDKTLTTAIVAKVKGAVTPAPTPMPPAPPAPVTMRSYQVQEGDTLWSIAERHNIGWQTVYRWNEAIIERTARDHGYADSHNGSLIFPGTMLTV